MKEDYYIRKLNKAFEDTEGDTEAAHSLYDDILCELLLELGYNKLVDRFNALERWYA